MADIARPVLVIQDWYGMVNNIDPVDFPAGGAEEQVNVCSITYGELTARGGLRQVTFEEGS